MYINIHSGYFPNSRVKKPPLYDWFVNRLRDGFEKVPLRGTFTRYVESSSGWMSSGLAFRGMQYGFERITTLNVQYIIEHIY